MASEKPNGIVLTINDQDFLEENGTLKITHGEIVNSDVCTLWNKKREVPRDRRPFVEEHRATVIAKNYSTRIILLEKIIITKKGERKVEMESVHYSW